MTKNILPYVIENLILWRRPAVGSILYKDTQNIKSYSPRNTRDVDCDRNPISFNPQKISNR